MFEALPLHDATLRGLRLEWREARCTVEIATAESRCACLVFDGVSDVHIPKHHPWGPSVSINALNQRGPNTFEIQLQSGDTLRVEAAAWSFEAGKRNGEL